MSWSGARFFLFAALCVTTLHASTEVIFGPERPLPPRAVVPAAGLQMNPVGASSGNGVMVAWQDETEGRAGLYVARLTSSGSLIDRSQLHVSPGAAREISISWNGAAYVVVWSDFNAGSVRAATFSADGAPVLPPFTVAENATTFRGASGSLGGRTLIVHLDLTDGRYAATLLGANGRIERRIELAGVTSASQVMVRSDDHNFFVFTKTSRLVALSPVPPPSKALDVISVSRITSSGVLLDPSAVPVVETEQGGEFDVAFGGSYFALVTADASAGATFVRRFLVDHDTLQSTALPEIPTPSATSVAVVAVDGRFVAFWSAEVQGVRRLAAVTFALSGDGAVVQTDRVGGAALEALWSGASIILVWNGVSSSVADADRSVRGEKAPVDFAAVWQLRPSIASSGSESLAVWFEVDDAGASRVVGSILDHGEPRGLIALSEPFETQPGRVDVVFTGSVFVVTWDQPDGESSRQVVIRRVSMNGELLDPAPARVVAGNIPAIASDGAGVLLLWLDNRGTMGLMLSKDGELPTDTTPVLISRGLGARVATNGSEYLVVAEAGTDYWQFPAPNLIDIEGVRVTSNGVVLDAAPIAIAATPRNEHVPAVSSDGRDFLVAYATDAGAFAERVGLEVKRVLSAGALAEGTAESEGLAIAESGVRSVPSLAFSGSRYVLAWRHSEGYASRSEARLALVATDGRSPEFLPPLSSSSAFPTLHVAVAAAVGGIVDVLYGAMQPDAAYGPVPRLLTRRVVVDPKPRTRRVRR